MTMRQNSLPTYLCQTPHNLQISTQTHTAHTECQPHGRTAVPASVFSGVMPGSPGEQIVDPGIEDIHGCPQHFLEKRSCWAHVCGRHGKI